MSLFNFTVRRFASQLLCGVLISLAFIVPVSAYAEEPGTVERQGMSVFKAPAPEQSDYFIPGIEDIYPPVFWDRATRFTDAQSGVAVRMTGGTWSSLALYTDGVQFVYSPFLNDMGFTSGDRILEWPTNQSGFGEVSYLGASSISELYGAYLSRAYHSPYISLSDSSPTSTTAGFFTHGYPRVGAVQDVRIPPDYPPITQNISLSNSPLLPATVAGTSRAIYSNRETIDGKLDLLTGQPLLREVDLEIPFGGAVFRRIRTYSEAPDVGISAHNWDDDGSWERSKTPGWHGSGWMSSDAPLFLIDAGYSNTMTVPNHGVASAPRCIFSLDAHQSIPFTRQVSPATGGNAGGFNVDYIAPEWFDAILLHSGGEWNGASNSWSVYPDEFKVILNKRSVIYTIKPYYEDVAPFEHQLPSTYPYDNRFFIQQGETGYSGSGVPYYGLVTEVQDRSGNRVEYSYSNDHQPFDGLTYTARDLVNGMMEVVEKEIGVQQRGWYKGMIDHVKLYPAGEDEAAWTLLYTYRAFAARRDSVKEWSFWDHESYPPALHSVVAYKEDIITDQLDRDLILKCHEEPDIPECQPDVPVSNGSEVIDISQANGGPVGSSGPSIDHTPFEPTGSPNLLTVSAIDNPPFSELILGDPNYCETWMLPVPVKGNHANQLDYQDIEIGAMGEGEDTSAWTLPANWVKQVRYSYADPAQYKEWGTGANTEQYSVLDDFTAKSSGPVEFPSVTNALSYKVGSSPVSDVVLTAAYLLKVKTIERDEDIDSSDPAATAGIEQYWLYRYQDTEGPKDTLPNRYYYDWGKWDGWNESNSRTVTRRLSYRYGPKAVDNLAPNTVWGISYSSKNEYVNHIIGLDEDELVETIAGDDVPLSEGADTGYLRWSEPYHLTQVEEGSGNSGSYSGIAYPGSWVAFDGDHSSGASAPSGIQKDIRDNYLGAVKSDQCPDLQISQADPARTAFLPEGTSVFTNRDAQGNQRWYRMYRFLSTPGAGNESDPGNDEIEWRGIDSAETQINGHDPIDSHHMTFGRGPELVLPDNQGVVIPGASQALYYYPYRFAIANQHSYGWDNGEPSTLWHTVLERKDPMWWTVVDEYESLDEALSTSSSLTHIVPSNGDGWGQEYFTDESPWMTRRVVAMNSAGLVLSDRTWDIEDGVNAPPAILEAFVYDDYLRMTMKFSRGWGSALANGLDEGIEGLVQVFTYADAVEVAVNPDNSTNDNGDEFIRLDVPREIKGVWLNKGCITPQINNPASGDPGELHISEIEYYQDKFDPLPEVFEGQLYSQVVYDLTGNDDLGTLHHRVEYWEQELENGQPVDDDFDVGNPPVKWEINTGAQFKRDPASPDLRPVDITFYDRNGRLIWRVSGAMEGIIDDPENSTASGINADVDFSVGIHDELFLDYHQYDDEGREYFTVQDIDVREGPFGEGGIQGANGFNLNDIRFPDGVQQSYPIDEESPHGVLFLGSNENIDNDEIFDSLSDFWAQLNEDIGLLYGIHRQAQAPSLDLVTYREFTRFGPSKVVYPTGVRDLYDYSLRSDYLTELKAMGIEFDGESWGFSGQQLYDSDFNGNHFVGQVQSVMDDLLADQWDGNPYSLSSDIFRDNRLQVIADVTPNYDSAGRLVSMTVADPESEAEPIEQFVAYDGWGNILRSQDAEGLIDHITYDKFGRKHKTFKGSKDRHEIWGTVDIGQDNDDMFLVEKLFYGLGTNNAGMVTHKWNFREKSENQYEIDWDDASEGEIADAGYIAGSSSANETSSGLLEHYKYDWRMRRVITQYRGLDALQSNTGVIREERVFLDNADRVRFVAVYEEAANANAPSPDFEPGNDLPEPSAFFTNGASSNLRSLHETIYNGAGQTVESKVYDPDTVDVMQPGYLVTHNFTDHGNRPTWSRDHGQRISKNVYDAKGRMAWSSTWAGGIELSRSVNVYGPADTVDMMLTFERIDTEGIPTDPFDDVNKRVAVLHQWFDQNQRLIARADFGEEEFSGTVAAYVGAINRPEEAPVVLSNLPSPSGEEESNDPDPAPDQMPTRELVGVEYPSEWIGPDGRGLARVAAYWYGPHGKKNAMLNLLDAYQDSAGTVQISYTIDRSEYNNYGQKVLDHSYGYEIAAPISTGWPDSDAVSASGQFLNGMLYDYEFSEEQGFVDPGAQNPPPPTLYAGTKVRRIMPVTEGYILEYNPELRRYEVDWITLSDPRRSTELEYNAPVVEPGFELPSMVIHPEEQSQSGPYYNNSVWPIGYDDWGYLGVSNRPDLVKAVHLPDPVTGETGSGTGYSLFYFYYADGLPAIRLDTRGIAIEYIYDERGNLLRLECDDSNMPLVDSLGLTDEQLPSNSIRYEYDVIDRLVLATTGRDYSDGTTFRVDTESLIEYDAMGNMLKEYQAREDTVDALTTPFVGYEWERVYAQTGHSNGYDLRDNINRIASMTYPVRTGTYDGSAHSPRMLSYGYGIDGSVSDLLSRVEDMTASGGAVGAQLGQVADYQYSGINRLEAVMLGTPSGSSPGVGDHVMEDVRTFDGFGRVDTRTVSAWQSGAPTATYQDVMNSEFGYDLGNRRLFERLSQQDVDASTSRSNTHSSYYEHDLLGRLVGEHYGTLHTDGFDGIDHGLSAIDPLSITYGLDSLNRRRGGAGGAPGIQIWEDTDKDAVVDAGELLLTQSHQIDERGGLTALTGLLNGAADDPIAQDASGAITGLHGRDIYYDWLGRPVLIRDENNKPIASMSYDGFGRLATRKALWPAASKTTVYRTESYYYDGVRRIQEVFTDPVDALPPWPVAPGEVVLNSGGNTERTEAEYIWSAASGQPFDTCHVQIDWWDREAWFIQDHATGTVRGFTDANGELVRQYRYDAFGNLKSEDVFGLADAGGLFENFRQRLGHQGLFAERVDADTTAMVFELGGEVWYQNRSRWYVPELGRFLSSDPNSTGVPTMMSLAMLGKRPAGPPSGSFSWSSHYGEGWDTFTAYGANPMISQDPTGLFGLFSGMMTGLDMLEFSEEAMGMAAYGVSQQVRTYEMTSGYAENQLLDMDWALDMSPQEVSNIGGHSRAGDVGMYASGSLALARVKPIESHHIMTSKGVYGMRNKRLLDRIGLDIDGDWNRVDMHHRGRHNPKYHIEVRGIVSEIVNIPNISAEEKRARVIRQFDGLKPFLVANPDYLYDSIGGKRTRWAGPRTSLKGLR